MLSLGWLLLDGLRAREDPAAGESALQAGSLDEAGPQNGIQQEGTAPRSGLDRKADSEVSGPPETAHVFLLRQRTRTAPPPIPWLVESSEGATQRSERIAEVEGPSGRLSIQKRGYAPVRGAVADAGGRELRFVLSACAGTEPALRVVRAGSGEPIPGALVETPHGPAGRTGPDGELTLPFCAGEGTALRVSADGFLTVRTTARADEWPELVELQEGVHLRLALERDDGSSVRRALLWPSFEPPSATAARVRAHADGFEDVVVDLGEDPAEELEIRLRATGAAAVIVQYPDETPVQGAPVTWRAARRGAGWNPRRGSPASSSPRPFRSERTPTVSRS